MSKCTRLRPSDERTARRDLVFDGTPMASDNGASHTPVELDLSALTALTRLEFRNYPPNGQKLTWQRLDSSGAGQYVRMHAKTPHPCLRVSRFATA